MALRYPNISSLSLPDKDGYFRLVQYVHVALVICALFPFYRSSWADTYFSRHCIVPDYIVITYYNFRFHALEVAGVAVNIHHSCEPNVTVECWWSSGKPQLVFRAKSQILVHETLTFDYGQGCANNHCPCGAPTRRGTIGSAPKVQNPRISRDESGSEYEPSESASVIFLTNGDDSRTCSNQFQEHTSASRVRRRRCGAYLHDKAAHQDIFRCILRQ